MSYPNIVRKCSVCEGCGSCDYEYEVEYLGETSGDYSPLPRAILNKSDQSDDYFCSFDKREDIMSLNWCKGCRERKIYANCHPCTAALRQKRTDEEKQGFENAMRYNHDGTPKFSYGDDE